MTKINKLGKSTFVIAILSFLLVAVLAFGGTYAYFSATAAGTKATIVTGTLALEPGTKAFTVAGNTSLVPNETVAVDFGDLAIKGNTVSALRIKIEFDDADITLPQGATVDKAAVKNMIKIEMNASDISTTAGAKKWYAFDTTDKAYYYTQAVGGENYNTKVADLLTDITVKFAAAAGNEYQGITLKYNVTVEVVQAEHVAGTTGVTLNADGTVTFADVAAVKSCFTAYATQHPAN